jgi:hypothetical protein
MKAGTAVIYEGADGEEFLALVRTSGGKTEANLIVFTREGIAMHNGVPRNDDGGGHTFRPA